jgi:excisionase family DNA binding protein
MPRRPSSQSAPHGDKAPKSGSAAIAAVEVQSAIGGDEVDIQTLPALGGGFHRKQDHSSGDEDDHDARRVFGEFAEYRILTSREAARFTGIALPTLYRLAREGKVPAPIQISGNRYGWQIRDLIAWIESRRRVA